MKIQELAVGNYVEIHKEIYKVTRVYQATIEGTLITDEESKCIPYFKDVKPILITPEWLEKNGFKWNSFYFLRKLLIENIKIEVESVGFKYAICIYFSAGEWSRVYIEYIHQLQNFLTLCGVKLEIKM